MLCTSCGRRLVNDDREPNAARWTHRSTERETAYPYCADSPECMRDTERQAYGYPL
jgi:hypothetical protein